MTTIPIITKSDARWTGFLGPAGVGKDHLARNLCGSARVVKVAAPLYELAELLTGYSVDKAEPGARALLQRLGAWGRGDVNADHPWSAERAVAVYTIRELLGLAEFGECSDYWAGRFDRYLTDAAAIDGSDFVCTDIRFMEEVAVWRKRGPVYAVLASRATLAARRAALGYGSGPMSDASERLANAAMDGVDDGSIGRWLRLNGLSGVIWNDDAEPPESLNSVLSWGLEARWYRRAVINPEWVAIEATCAGITPGPEQYKVMNVGDIPGFNPEI